MKKKSTKLNLTEPINQKNLFGYDNYFNLFKDLYTNNKLPNCILLTGQKGIGKATFAYHFINFLLSNKLKNEYILNKFEITEDSNTYKQIKTGTHPRITTAENIKNFKRQIKMLGFSYDWDREINTTDEKYYKWTQWIFLQLYKKGLAYEAEVPVNWCPELHWSLQPGPN